MSRHRRRGGIRRNVAKNELGRSGGRGNSRLSAHVLKRMEDSGFSEVELRRMLEHGSGYRHDIVEDRLVVDARHAKQAWEVIVEPTLSADCSS